MMKIDDLRVERRGQEDMTLIIKTGVTTVIMTPPITDDYWMYRVIITDDQALQGFPKFFTVGIGFAIEDDWNCNLPFSSSAEYIRQHIWHNRGPSIPDTPEGVALVIRGIELIQEAVAQDKEEESQ